MEVLKKRFLVIQTAFLGDCLLTIPFLFRLYQKTGGCEIDVITTPSAAPVFASFEFVNRVYILDKKNKHKGLKAVVHFAQSEFKGTYTALYSLHRSFRSTLLSMFINAEQRITFNTTAFSFLFDRVKPYKPRLHEIERNLVLLEENSFSDEINLSEHIDFNESQIKKTDAIWGEIPAGRKDVLAIAPGSVWETKRYPAEYFVELCDYCISQGFSVLIIGGPEEKSIGDFIISKIRSENIVNLCGRLEILETILLLKSVKLLISNDSAPAHMAFLSGTPVIMLYCSTVPEFGFYPYGKKSDYISLNLNCKPCGVHGFKECPTGTFECGKNLKPGLVIEKLRHKFDDN